MDNMVVLVADGDRRIRNLIGVTLRAHDYKCITAADGENTILMASSYMPDVIVMETNFPDMEGTEIIKTIRSWSEVPIIIISTRSEDHDKVMALDAGADDYLTKPFSVEELLARLRVMERRYMHTAAEESPFSVFRNGRLVIDYSAGCVYVSGTEVHLTPTEYRILCLLAKNVGRVLTNTMLATEIWGNAWENNVMSLRVYIAALRKKTEPEPWDEPLILTHTGVGYRMVKLKEHTTFGVF